MTSLICLESSIHGRERRQLRNICKRDLQAAVKYGAKSPGRVVKGQTRWMYEFADVIYITDESSTKEITSYVKPIELRHLNLTSDEEAKFYLHQKLAQNNPDICTSHAVLVIDQSASMRTCDVENFKTRSDSVYGHLALEYLTEQIENGASYTDVVSIIEMKDSATLVMHRAPICKFLFNQLVVLQRSAFPSSHGNYMPSIKLIEEILGLDAGNSQCACVVLFLSDGNPSDHIYMNKSAFELELKTRLFGLGECFGRQLTFGCIAFCNGSVSNDCLKMMADSVSKGGSKGIFFHSQLDSASLIQSLTHLSTSLQQSKLRMTFLDPAVARQAQKVKWESNNFDGDVTSLYDEGWKHYLKDTVLWEYVPGSNPDFYDWCPRNRLKSNAIGFAKRTGIFGQGAERIVYELREIGLVNKQLMLVGDRLVAKDNRFKEESVSAKTNMKFHTSFAKTQLKASELADEFNKATTNLENKARITFLKCYCYGYAEDEFDDGFLVERLIDKDKYRKWNDNKGTVHYDCLRMLSLNSHNFDETEFMQAFSHWSYRFSNRKFLICDLQGVLNESNPNELVFELTDPVIHHYDIKRPGKNYYGRTDHGKKGFFNFFKTHTCGRTCKMIGLDANDVATTQNY
jgi:hypothetical protein